MPTPLRIATRGSDLALWQARFIRDSLMAQDSDLEVELHIIKTSGDRIQNVGLHEVSGTGFFTSEVEAALLENRADVAVHSFKDLPTKEHPKLGIYAVPKRAQAADVLVIHPDAVDPQKRWQLKEGASVGTCSLRRRAHLLALRPDLRMMDLRGNVPTRYGKAKDRTFDAVCLAEAGMRRIGLGPEDDEVQWTILPVDDVTPAPSQGALAVQCRHDDSAVATRLAALHDVATAEAVKTERALLSKFGGGCHLPLGVYCHAVAEGMHLRALIASPTGDVRIETVASGSAADVVAKAHAELVAQGAEKYI